jgi:putative oxidoreductase
MHMSAFVLLFSALIATTTATGGSRKSLANLLLASHQSTAFSPSGASIQKNRIGRRTPATTMISLQGLKDKKGKTPVPEPEEDPTDLSEKLIVSDELQQNVNELAILLARLIAAAVMFHHGQEKILSPEAFTRFTIDKYFSFLPGPHLFWTYFAGYTQLIAPIFLSLGIFSRAAAVSLIGTMLGAFYFSFASGGTEGFPFFELAGLSATMKYGVPSFHNYGFETPALYVAIFLMVAVGGPGKFSLAQLLGFNDDKSLFGKIKQ